METLIEQYKTWLLANSQAFNTIDSYTRHVRIFLTATGVTDIAHLTEDIINDFFAKNRPNWEQATVNSYVNALGSFFEYKNINLRLPKTKTPPQTIVEVITKDEFKNKILPMVEREFENWLQVKTVLYFLYGCGLRKEDATNLKRSQFNLDHNYVQLKIQKQRIEKQVPITEDVKDVLIRFFASEGEDQNAFNLTPFQIKSIFQKLIWLFPELHLHPHKFRTSFATNAFKDGMDIVEIQQILGHKSIETTMRYIQPPTDGEIREKFLRLEAERNRKGKRKNVKPHA